MVTTCSQGGGRRGGLCALFFFVFQGLVMTETASTVELGGDGFGRRNKLARGLTGRKEDMGLS
jgi:hypothetical protein